MRDRVVLVYRDGVVKEGGTGSEKEGYWRWGGEERSEKDRNDE